MVKLFIKIWDKILASILPYLACIQFLFFRFEMILKSAFNTTSETYNYIVCVFQIHQYILKNSKLSTALNTMEKQLW